MFGDKKFAPVHVDQFEKVPGVKGRLLAGNTVRYQNKKCLFICLIAVTAATAAAAVAGVAAVVVVVT